MRESTFGQKQVFPLLPTTCPGAAGDGLRTPSGAGSPESPAPPLHHRCEAGREGGCARIAGTRPSFCSHPVRPGAQSRPRPASAFPSPSLPWAASQNQGVSLGVEPGSQGRADGLISPWDLLSATWKPAALL